MELSYPVVLWNVDMGCYSPMCSVVMWAESFYRSRMAIVDDEAGACTEPERGDHVCPVVLEHKVGSQLVECM